MIPKDGINLSYVKDVFQRRFWYIVLPFFLVFTGTVLYCIKAPKIYQSSTLILVQPQEVPTDYVRPTVTSDPVSRMNLLTEQVMSRPRFEEIIKKHNLYPKILATYTMYDAVEKMRQDVHLEVKESQQQTREASPIAFEISYEGPEPATVRDVTTSIANLFIEDNVKLREQQAAGTSKFLERELERMREELRGKEELVRDFKEKHMGQLPEQMENNYRILAQLQQYLDSINASLQQTEDRKVILRTQLGTLESVQAGSGGSVAEGGASTVGPTASLDELRQQLESLRSRYTENHPDIVRLKATIEKMEEEPAASSDPSDEGQVPAARALTKADRLVQVQRSDLSAQLALVDKQLTALAEDKKNTEAQIHLYRERIESGPKVEQMFVDLRRGYQEAYENYQSLLQKRMSAELAENLERTQKGEQFKILEPANLPRRPVKPNVLRLLSIGLMLALTFGFGLALAREHLDSTFWRRKDLESVIQLPVIISIPVVATQKERRRRLLKRTGAAGVLVSMACILVYALVVLWQRVPMEWLLSGP